jgi:hypothetical protein
MDSIRAATSMITGHLVSGAIVAAIMAGGIVGWFLILGIRNRVNEWRSGRSDQANVRRIWVRNPDGTWRHH